MKNLFFTLVIAGVATSTAQAQTKFGDNKTSINASSLLELESTNKGLLMPRISLTNTTTWGLASNTPVNGMMVYNTNPAMTGSATAPTLAGIVGMYYWDGAKWVGMSGIQKPQTDSTYWALKGNTGTTPPATVGTAVGSNNFWGTTDAKNLAVGTNSTTRAIFNQNGSLHGGNNTFDSVLSVPNSIVWGSYLIDSSTINGGSATFGADNTIRNGSSYNLTSGSLNNVYGSQNMVSGSRNILKSSSGGHSAYNILSGFRDTLSESFGTLMVGTRNRTAGQSDYNIIGGNNNKLDGIASQNIVTGMSNNIYQASNVAVFGQGHKDSADYSLISGTGNTLSPTAVYSSISGSENSVITSMSSRGNLLFGEGNQVKGTYSMANVVGGYQNILDVTESSSNLNAIFGYQNALSGPRAGENIVGGRSHQVRSTGNIVTGSANIIGLNSNYNVVGGNYNVVPDNAANINQFGGRNAIFGGENKDSAGYTLVAGYQNTLSASAWYSTVSGSNNHVYGGSAVGIFGQANNIITTPGFFNNYGGGFIAGSSNNITNNNSSAILGELNTVYGNTSGINAVLVAGSNNKDSASYTFIAGQLNTIKPAGANGVALGAGNTVGHSNSFALGNGATTTKAYQLVANFPGGVVFAQLPAYATDAAADADATLPSGSLYKLTGSRAVFQKP